MAASSTLDSSSYHHNNNVGDVSLDYSFTRDSVPSAKSSLGPSSSTQRQATRRNGSTTTNGAAAAASSSQQPRQDVWSQILLSVRTARNTATLPVVVLGEPQSGKSTLLRGLAEGCPSGCIEAGATRGGDEDEDRSEGVATPALKEGAAQGGDQRGKRDLGLAYGYCDVPDDEGEDILARLSFYTLSSSDEALLSLLPFALRSSSSGQDPTLAAASTSQATSSATALRKPLPSLPALRDSLFLIVLDWQRPQSFLDELRTWISVIKEAIAAAATAGTAGTSNEERSRRAAQEAMLDEMKDALEAHIRGYVPPASNGAAAAAIGEDDAAGGAAAAPADEGTPDGAPAPAIVPVSAPLSLGQAGSRGAAGTAMPLDEGVLDENLGVGIVVVLAKSDHVYQLERDRDFKEEQFDYIQQVLRTICLKYGAALFSTAQSRPTSFSVLRQYLVHRLLSTSSVPGGGPDVDLSTAADGAPAAASSSSRGYPFTHPPSTIERDILLVPSGWDSWGKIVALREGFHPSLTAQGWEFDCRVEERRRSRKLPRSEMGRLEKEVRDEEAGEGSGTGAGTSACRLWEDVLGDYRWDRTARGSVSGGGASQPAAGSTNSLAAPDAQSFLAQHHATLQKEAAAAAAAGPSSSSAGASDPRAKFARTGSSSSAAAQLAGGRSSIVGPMQSSSLSGPAVERAMGLAQRDDSLSAGGGADGLASPPIDGSRPSTKRRESREHRSSAIGGSASRPDSPAIGGVGSTHSSRDSGVTRASSPGGAGASASTKQSEVLQSFFQDLLRGKGGGSGGSAGASPSGGGAAKSGAARRTERGAGGE